MSTRNDLPKIKPDEQPSIFNHEAGVWGFWGSLIGLTAAATTVISKVGLSASEKLIETTTRKYAPILHGSVILGVIYGAIKGNPNRKENKRRDEL